MYSIALNTTVHTAHRLPQVPGKCASLHGHSWEITYHVTGGRLSRDSIMLADFGDLKEALFAFPRMAFDHGTTLGAADPLVAPLRAAGCKVFLFGQAIPDQPFPEVDDLPWPTVEAWATLLWRMGDFVLRTAIGRGELPPFLELSGVHVMETATNSVDYTPDHAARRASMLITREAGASQ